MNLRVDINEFKMIRGVARNQKEVRRFREKIFKSKDECRKIFAKDSYERKLEIAFSLYKDLQLLRKFKPKKVVMK